MNKKKIIIRVLFYLIILVVVGWSLNETREAKITDEKYTQLLQSTIEATRLLREENEAFKKENESLKKDAKSLKKQLSEKQVYYYQKHEDDIKETAFRYRLEKDDKQNDIIYYLYIMPKTYQCIPQYPKDGDPSDEFMRRFKDHHQVLKKASQCAQVTNPVRGEWEVRDKDTNKEGAIIDILSIEWKTDTKVVVACDYIRGPLYGHGNTLQIVLKENKWVVETILDNWHY